MKEQKESTGQTRKEVRYVTVLLWEQNETPEQVTEKLGMIKDILDAEEVFHVQTNMEKYGIKLGDFSIALT